MHDTSNDFLSSASHAICQFGPLPSRPDPFSGQRSTPTCSMFSVKLHDVVVCTLRLWLICLHVSFF